jgi:hypothetical protein
MGSRAQVANKDSGNIVLDQREPRVTREHDVAGRHDGVSSHSPTFARTDVPQPRDLSAAAARADQDMIVIANGIRAVTFIPKVE